MCNQNQNQNRQLPLSQDIRYIMVQFDVHSILNLSPFQSTLVELNSKKISMDNRDLPSLIVIRSMIAKNLIDLVHLEENEILVDIL